MMLREYSQQFHMQRQIITRHWSTALKRINREAVINISNNIYLNPIQILVMFW